jgi:hypothetical protein
VTVDGWPNSRCGNWRLKVLRLAVLGLDKNIWGAAERVRENSDWSEVDIRVIAGGLTSGRTIEVPFWEVFDTVLLAPFGQFYESLLTRDHN